MSRQKRQSSLLVDQRRSAHMASPRDAPAAVHPGRRRGGRRQLRWAPARSESADLEASFELRGEGRHVAWVRGEDFHRPPKFLLWSPPIRRGSYRDRAVTCNIEVWLPTVVRPFGLVCRRIGRGFARRGCAQSKSGCPMCERPSSSRRLTGRVRWLRPRRWRRTTKTSSTRSRLTRSEARRGLDRGCGVWLRRQASAGRHRPG